MKRDFSLLSSQQFDLLVCGGGIYGAWTAYDAALRGLRVAIVEQGDWAGATSSASSKLIHGGLRYLESYDFKLVKNHWPNGACCWQWRRIACGRCVSVCLCMPTAASAHSG